MIRTTRTCLLGKKYSNIPLFAQRVVSLPKLFMEFSVVIDKEEQPAAKQQEEKTPNFDHGIIQHKFNESFGEIKFAFLREIFNGSTLKKSGLMKRDTALRDFFNTLPAFTPPEIIKVLKLLIETNNRPVVSLKALCGLLCTQDNWKYTVRECADLLFTLARLSYRDQKVIRLIAEQLGKLNDFESPKLAGDILYSLAALKYRDCNLLDRLFKYILSCNYPMKTSLNCMKAASILNYSSAEVDRIIQNLAKLRETDFSQSKDYVTFIWSCIVLNKHYHIDIEHIATVLSENYVTRLLKSGVHPSVKWKLLNINGAAKQMALYNGPFLDTQSTYKILSLGIPNQKNSFLDSVLDVLTHIAPNYGVLKPLVNTGAGFYLDFEYTEHTKSDAEKDRASKLGIVLLNFNDICSDETLTGIAAFKLNLLQGMGYKTVVLRYSEYRHSDPLSEKIAFVREKIKNAVMSNEDSSQSAQKNV